jgi:Family of unknown function (DUF5906)
LNVADKAKQLVIALMFLGKLENFEKDNKLVSDEERRHHIMDHPTRAFLLQYQHELASIAGNMCNLQTPLVKTVKSVAASKDETSDWDILTATMSTFLLTEENKILMRLKEYMEKHDRQVITLIYDGMIIAKQSDETDGPPATLLSGAEAYIRTHTGYPMKLAVKPFESVYDHLAPNRTYDKKYLDSLAYDEALDELRANRDLGYHEKKYLFQRFHAKVRNPPCYVTQPGALDSADSISKDYSECVTLRSKEHMSEALYNVYYYDQKTAEKLNFFQEWLKDDFIREYESVEFVPPPLECPNRRLNLWQGFAVNQMAGDATKGSEQLFLSHVSVLVNHEPANVDYLVKWLAHLVQRPGELNGIAVVLISSKEGAGKNMFIDLLARMIGEQYYFETANVKRDLFSQFSNGRFNKLLINIDETNRKKVFEFQDEMKNMITSKCLHYEKKNVDQITVRNFNRFIITSNHEIPIVAGDNDRRYVIFRCSNEKVGDKQYFESFARYMENSDNIKAIYQYLMSVDISTVNWIRDRPVTQ